MNIKLDIDATPQELRSFFGLPDVEPLQREMLEQMRIKMEQAMQAYDPATVMQVLMPEQIKTMEGFWKAFTQPPRKKE